MEKVLDKFLRYVKIDTESDENSDSFPSTEKQKNLSALLKNELNALGIDAVLDEYGYVYAKLPANTKNATKLGFIAHVDTSPAVSGKAVLPKVSHFDGKDIILDKSGSVVLSEKEYPELKYYLGQNIVTASGDTLLGADDKAGVAEIMSALEYLTLNPDVKHGEIFVCFTPDEEVGRGVDFFDTKKFGADFAYTIDGGQLGEIEYENFNAASAVLSVTGVSIHPGTAKGKMLNAIELAMEFHNCLPKNQHPAYTEGYDGFFLLNELCGSVESATAKYIIRDHDENKFKEKCDLFSSIVTKLNKAHSREIFKAEIKEQYRNMKEKILPHFHLIENAKLAMQKNDITPIIQPIRGGTDGARLSFIGIPCPNLSTGGHNFHGRYEYIPTESMEKMVAVILTLIDTYSNF